MDDITAKLAARDRFRRNRWRTLTPAQRVEEMMRLQERAWHTLRSNPEAYNRWFRCNLAARATRRPAEGPDAT